MSYAEQKSPLRSIVGFTLVALFHVILIWALVNGLGKNIVDVIKAPLETKIIKDTKPPPPEAPPPPPPQLAAPPPPYIPPPDIQIQPPPQATTNAITTVTHAAPPTTTFTKAPPQPAPVATPDRDVSAVPISAPPLEYPEEMQDEGREGKVGISCDVDTTGHTSNCSVGNVVGGQAFARAALQYVRAARYAPATHNGVAVPQRHTWVITFRLNG